jgi:adenylate cyclase
MTQPLLLRVYDNQQLVGSLEAVPPVELGRQADGEPPPYRLLQDAGISRLVLARLEEATVSRKHARLEWLADGRLRITNVSATLPLRLSDGTELKPGARHDLSLPFVLTLGSRAVRVQLPDDAPVGLHSLAEATRAPQPGAALDTPSTFPPPGGAGPDLEAVIRWLQVTLDVLQSAAHAADFFDKAARAVVELVGLDAGRVLLWEQGEWKTRALYPTRDAGAASEPVPSRRVLDRLRADKRTFWETPDAAQDEGSLAGVQAVVAAPILDPRGEVLGALYGDRRTHGPAAGPRITKPEAMLVEVLASGLAAGLTRLKQEQVALAAQVRFEQFFTPELARQLTARPELLTAQVREVTILFADICGFSRISERLGPARTLEWMSNVLGALSECVLAQRGVLANYIGDELQAMWGAPEEQPDHPRLACRAALAMLEQVPVLNVRWQSALGEPLALGIGVNTGMACVGNIGSPLKFMYGAQGNTVNLASRVQGATKYLKNRLLVTGETYARLGEGFTGRRLGTVRVVNIAELVALYELTTPGQEDETLRRVYEEALAALERQDFRRAARLLGEMQLAHPGDGPSLVLLARAVQARADEDTPFDVVWRLPGK